MKGYQSNQYCDECEKNTHHEGHPNPIKPELIIFIECIECGSINEYLELQKDR